MPFTAFRRFGPASYYDGVSLPRGGLVSSTLPSARAVSVAVHQGLESVKEENVSISLMVMQFGQFLDHDLDLTATQAQLRFERHPSVHKLIGAIRFKAEISYELLSALFLDFFLVF